MHFDVSCNALLRFVTLVTVQNDVKNQKNIKKKALYYTFIT